jgi:hypothetical protein
MPRVITHFCDWFDGAPRLCDEIAWPGAAADGCSWWMSGAAQGTVSAAAPHSVVSDLDNCLACHNGLTAASGEDVSIGTSWRASMMANSSRDPYWQASVRREVTTTSAQAAIESAVRSAADVTRRRRSSRAELPCRRRDASDEHRLAADGVSAQPPDRPSG